MDGRNDTMAQAVFLAQLQAAKNNCQCSTCKILRRASDMMTASFLKPQATPQGGSGELADIAAKLGGETIEGEVL